MSKRNPCYACDKRRISCHSDCKDYISWRKNKDIKNELIRKSKFTVVDEYKRQKRIEL